jgi:competence protein ComEC
VRPVQRGEILVLGGARQEAVLEVLHPPPDSSDLSSNESSVVLLFRYRGQAVALFTGDAGAPTEERLAVPHVELLQAGHHGSRFSTSEHLLLATSPRVAVVSVGDNNYGHPHPDVLQRLAQHAVVALTTQANGAVRFDLGSGGALTTMVGTDTAP